jgi:hypothetical protein
MTEVEMISPLSVVPRYVTSTFDGEEAQSLYQSLTGRHQPDGWRFRAVSSSGA